MTVGKEEFPLENDLFFNVDNKNKKHFQIRKSEKWDKLSWDLLVFTRKKRKLQNTRVIHYYRLFSL